MCNFDHSKMKSITLVGGGLAGSLVSVYLAKRGYEVNIYERRPDMRNVKIPAGRSINLALSTRGISALKKVGLRPSRKIKLFNGSLECRFMKYEMYKGTKKVHKMVRSED